MQGLLSLGMKSTHTTLVLSLALCITVPTSMHGIHANTGHWQSLESPSAEIVTAVSWQLSHCRGNMMPLGTWTAVLVGVEQGISRFS